MCKTPSKQVSIRFPAGEYEAIQQAFKIASEECVGYRQMNMSDLLRYLCIVFVTYVTDKRGTIAL